MKNDNNKNKTNYVEEKASEIHARNTAAITNESGRIKDSNVTIPNEYCTMCAKDWVDDGSKL